MYYLKLKIMKKNFYNQRTPQLLSWGTVKRSAAAIWLAAVMLLAPAAVNAVDLNLASPVTNNSDYYNAADGTHLYRIVSNEIRLLADSTYAIHGTASASVYIRVQANATLMFNNARISTSSTSAFIIDAGKTVALQLTGATNRLYSSGANGITLSSNTTGSSRLTISGDGTLAVQGTPALINLGTASILDISSGTFTLNGDNSSADYGITLGNKSALNISGGTINIYRNAVHGIYANNASPGNERVINITGGTIGIYRNSGDGIFVGNRNTLKIGGGTITLGSLNGAAGANVNSGKDININVSSASGTAVITGGSINTLDPINKVIPARMFDGGGDPVKLVTASGLSTTYSTINTNNGAYGYQDVTGAPIYLWLPESAETVTVRGDDGLDYKGTIVGDFAIDPSRTVTLLPQGTPSGGGASGTTVAGDPPGWSSCPGDLIPGAQYSGDTYEVEFLFPPYSEDKKVAISVDGDLKDYITVPDTIILRKGKTSLMVPYTVKPVPADAEGKAITGSIHATVDGAGTPLPISGHPFFNQLEENKTVSIDYNPRTTLWTGQVTLTVTNGDKRIYWYSVDGGKSWRKVDKANSVTFDIPAGAEWLYIKAAGSSTYIAFALDTNGNINAPVGLRRQIKIEDVSGFETLPGAGQHYVVSRQDFLFTVVSKSPIPSDKKLDVRTNRDNLTAEQDREIYPNGDDTYTIIIKSVQQDVIVSILIADGTAAIDGSNVWGANGQLYITSAKAANASIYALTGSLVKSVALTAGETAATSLPAGIYVVTLGGNTYKAVVK
jgi:hypothetical protein